MSNAIAAFQSAREGEIPYVLLPYPKADMGQKDYYNVISNFVAGTVMPAGQSEDDIERIGMVLDYLGAYSEPIFEAFVENTLYYKYAKDLESVTVFSSIMENIPFCELGILYDWGQIRTKLDDAVATKTPIASKMKAWEKTFNRAATTSMGNRK